MIKLPSDYRGNVIRGISYWRLLFGEPELLIPIFEDDVGKTLQQIARGDLLLPTLLKCAPGHLRCSAYSLA